MKYKYILSLIAVVAISTVLSVVFSSGSKQVEAQVAYQTAPSFYVASSTTFTLTTTSQRLLATSSQRIAATIQPINCTNGSTQGAFLKAQRDQVATANTGLFAAASSTLQLTDYPNLPVPIGAVQGILGGGTCTVLVTEWRTQHQ